MEIFSPEVWQSLTDPDSDFYHPSWAPLLIMEVTVNTLLLLARIFLIYLFFTKKRLFPRLFIAVLIITPIFIYLDAQWATRILNEVMREPGRALEPILDPDTRRELIRSVGYLCIWGPYMKLSKRVKNTFIHPRMNFHSSADESLSSVF